jgi:hypothetical protein
MLIFVGLIQVWIMINKNEKTDRISINFFEKIGIPKTNAKLLCEPVG